jgi:diguanylate cyclase (GGDEF)-like protein
MMGRSFKEVLLLLLTAILTLAVIPLAILRLQNAQWWAALLDSSIVLVMLGLFLHVYYSRETHTPGIVLAVIFVVATLASLYLLGSSQIYWVYPALTAAFFLLETRYAVLLSVASLLAIGAMLWDSLFTTEILTVFLTLATNILFAYSFALTAKRRQSQLQRLATVDPLTGAGNRRAQNDKLDNVNAAFRRAQVPCSVMILDIDHFKKINDTHGHVVGDEILVEVADLIRTNIRSTESLYRYGGEEFIVVAEHTSLQNAGQLAEKLRRLIEQKSFCRGIHLTTSFGVAELQGGEGRKGWLNRADGALFRAKGEGRNRVAHAASHAAPTLVPQAAVRGESRA